MGIRLLAIGDMHLGRTPSRVPGELDGLKLGPAAAFERAVDCAITSELDAVVLAGDVVESDNARYEAYGALRRGVLRLADAGIPVYAVVGNHDVDALPRLARELPELHVVGAGGRWETVVLRSRSGATELPLVGWSFPAPHVSESPLATLESPPDGVWIGLLHADLDAAGSRYAPVASEALRGLGAAAWLLGHVHKPSFGGRERPLGYLGSLVGLDPGETGPHGPWLFELDEQGLADARQIPLAPLRFEWVEVDAEGIVDPADELLAVAQRALEQRAVELASEHPELRALGLRVILGGRSPALRALRVEAQAFGRSRLVGEHGHAALFVEKIECRARAARDLEALAGGKDALAALARDLLTLERGGPERETLLAAARQELSETTDKAVFAALSAPVEDDAALAERLSAAGWQLLEELLEQAGDAP